MATNQFVIGDTKQFDASLQSQDGVTLVGWTGTDNESLFMMLAAASEAKHKDGVVHINARLFQSILLGLLDRKFPTDHTIKVMTPDTQNTIKGITPDPREMTLREPCTHLHGNIILTPAESRSNLMDCAAS